MSLRAAWPPPKETLTLLSPDQARHLAAIRIQQLSRRKVANRRVVARRRDKALQQGNGPEYTSQDMSAAAVLQRVQRGKMARRRCRRIAREQSRMEEPHEYNPSHEKAAVAIQAGHRAKQGRKRVEDMRAKKAASA